MIILPSTYPVTCHTDHVGAGSTFVAIKGFNEDGVAHIAQALTKGATTIVVQEDASLSHEISLVIDQAGAKLIRVPNSRRALAQLSAQAHGFPAQKLKIIGITGTKGKTTSAFLLEHLMRSAGFSTALITTVRNSIGDHIFPMKLTTPQPDYLHMFFKVCVEAGVEYVIMEVAAQAMTMHRVDGIEFDGIIFTNFDQEHAEFYTHINDYFAAKCALLECVKSGAPILINGDDPWCAKIAKEACITFGANNQQSTMVITQLHDVKSCIDFSMNYQNQSYRFACPSLIGTFNVYNLVGVIGLMMRLGIDEHTIAAGLKTFKKVPGRLEGYTLPNGARCFIDYAHNPSSYAAVLSTIRPLTHHLIVVFGCGGDRDTSKRPLMGSVAARCADLIILTSDNPRSENPAIIVEDIKSGVEKQHMPKIMVELDREKAIKKAYASSRAGSIIMLLGKGPDEYQIIGKEKIRFSEAEIIQSLR